MDQEDDQFFDDVEFLSSSVVVEAGEVEVAADEVQDDAETVEGVTAGEKCLSNFLQRGQRRNGRCFCSLVRQVATRPIYDPQ